ncbi:hypothetical protein [Jonesia quinghaiensis]|uniref:hypothetical protein n=1 Tax=Jonesia quinghaiensis TaxID=262806 RepID=UPI00048E84ED|nr:hypothetical protein [Jonesia quinghaiensis]
MQKRSQLCFVAKGAQMYFKTFVSQPRRVVITATYLALFALSGVRALIYGTDPVPVELYFNWVFPVLLAMQHSGWIKEDGHTEQQK